MTLSSFYFTGWLKAVQAFVILGLLALVGACLITFGRFFVDKSKTVVSIIATVFNLAAGIAQLYLVYAFIIFPIQKSSFSILHITLVVQVLSRYIFESMKVK